MHFSRRSFMGAALAGTGAIAFSRPAQALRTDINIIVMFAYGAWDPVLSIDPKVQNDFVDVYQGGDDKLLQDIQNTGIDIWASPTKRPNITAFFDAWASKCAVVRGINVGSVAHQGSVIRMLTGTRTELSPDFAAVNAVVNGSTHALPYTDIGGGAFAGPFAASMGRLGERKQLVTLLDRDQAFEPAAGLKGHTKAGIYMPPVGNDSDVVNYLKKRAMAQQQVRAAHGENKARVDDYLNCFDRANAIRDNPAFQALQLGGGNTVAQITTAVQLLADKTSRSVFIRGGSGFDSHDNYAVEQNAEQDAFFLNLTTLMNKLKDENLVEKTLVVAMSEMGRTPKWNDVNPATRGKDHWPVTTALVVGGPVAPGVHGGTDDQLNARNIDLKTGALLPDSPNPTLLEYDAFIAGILAMCGLDEATRNEFLPNVTAFEGFIK